MTDSAHADNHATEESLQVVVTELADAFELSSRENHGELGHGGDWDTCPRVGCSSDRSSNREGGAMTQTPFDRLAEIGSEGWLRERFPDKDWHRHPRTDGRTDLCDGTSSTCGDRPRVDSRADTSHD